MTRKFNFVNLDLGYNNIDDETTASGRTYKVRSNVKYPSITTVLGHFGKAAIHEWRARVGEEEANRVSRHAATRGTKLHTLCENYMNGEFSDAKLMPHVKYMFNTVKPIIDEHIGDIYLQEKVLFSDRLRVAGRVDLIAEYKNTLSIIDFKTSSRVKTADDIHDYFMQTAFYSAALYERTGLVAKKSVIIMAVENDKPLVFEEDTHKWLPELIKKIKIYEKEKGLKYE